MPFESTLAQARSEATGSGGDLADLLLRARLAELEHAVLWTDRNPAGELGRLYDEAIDAGAVDTACRARVLQAWRQVRDGRPARAVRTLDDVLALPNLAEPDRVEARAVRAWALSRLDRSEEARKEGRRALEEAETMEVPLAAARAAAGLRRVETGEVAEDAAGRGLEMLRRLLDAVPEEDEDTIRRRTDVAELMQELGAGVPGEAI